MQNYVCKIQIKPKFKTRIYNQSMEFENINYLKFEDTGKTERKVMLLQ